MSWNPQYTRHYLAEVARAAAEIVGEKGLSKGEYVNAKGEVCHNGALLLAAGLPAGRQLGRASMTVEEKRQVFKRINDACISLLQRQGQSGRLAHCIIGEFFTHVWSDRQDTTAEDVILLFKEVAEELEGA